MPHVEFRFPKDLPQEAFFAEYWQKKPYLFRQAIDPDCLTFPAEELAGLSLESEIESRIIIQSEDDEYALHHGPFAEEFFGDLPENKWTLLVQDCDKWIDDVSNVLNAFDFLPSWRLDDIMISYASTGGSVGPHTDNYDVFLIQSSGQRHWQLDANAKETFREHPQLKLLAEFKTTDEWTLEPGDVLYLPPKLAHWGVALDDQCMTWSVGMRGPSSEEILDAWVQHAAQHHTIAHLTDQLNKHYDHPNMLTQSEIKQSVAITEQTLNLGALKNGPWLGEFLTEPKLNFDIPADEQAVTPDELETIDNLQRHPWLRTAIIVDEERAYFCAQGASFNFNADLYEWAEALSRMPLLEKSFISHALNDSHKTKLLCELVRRNWWVVDE